MKSQNDQFTQSSYAKGGPELRKVSYCLDTFFIRFFSSFLCILLFWVCFALFPLFWTFFQLFYTFSPLPKRNYYFFTTFSLFLSFFAIIPSFSVILYNAYLPLCNGDPLRVSLCDGDPLRVSLRLYLHNFLKEKTVLHCLDKLRNCCCNWFFYIATYSSSLFYFT